MMEEIQQHLNLMKDFQECFLAFLDKETNPEAFSQIVIQFIKDKKIEDDKITFKMVLYIISSISNNHHRSLHFNNKIFSIIKHFQDSIKKFFTNIEIYQIFQKNKLILLFLLKNKIMIMDQTIANIMIKKRENRASILSYFLPEIEKFVDKYQLRYFWPTELEKEIKSSDEKFDEFEQKRILGENDSYICKLIRNDSVEEFIAYINQNNYSINSNIKQSIYETNPYLIKYKQQTLIEYATFFGSIQIFRYLLQNNAQLPITLFSYAIHGKNAEIIHILEDFPIIENHPYFKNNKQEKYEELFIESIKCHHNDIAQYFGDNFLQNESIDHFFNYMTCHHNDIAQHYCINFLQDIDIEKIRNIIYIKYYNFSNIQIATDDLDIYFLTQYDYLMIIKILIEKGCIRSNSIIIDILFLIMFKIISFLYNFKINLNGI